MIEIPFKRHGNKQLLLRVSNFIQYFPLPTATGCYCEPFLGTGVVAFEFLKRITRTNVILNDLDYNVIKFFEYLKNSRDELERALEYRFVGSENVIDSNSELDDLIIWFLKQHHFRKKPHHMLRHFESFAQVLYNHDVSILNRPWVKAIELAHAFITRVRERPDPHIVIYLDPPYHETDNSKYNAKFDIEIFFDYLTNNEFFNEKKVFAFISLNKTPRVSQVFKNWHSKELYHLNASKSRTERFEMLYSNHPIRPRGKNVIDKFFVC